MTKINRALPLVMLAALGTTTLAAPASAADHPGERFAGELAKKSSTPTHVVLGAPVRSSSVSARQGDTLTGIAARNGVSVSALKAANPGVDPRSLQIGQKVAIPSGRSSAATGSTATGSTAKGSTSKGGNGSSTSSSGKRSGPALTVRSGETLSGISARTGVSVEALKQANGIGADNVIRSGQSLTIPRKGASSTSTGSSSGSAKAATGSSTKGSSGKGGYSVRSGDTLSTIAQRQGVSLSALQSANPGLDPQSLQVGHRLTVPSSRASSGTSSRPVGDTFLGRTYPEATVDAANRNHATLASRSAPSRASMQATVAATARKHGVDPALAQAISYQESGFNQRAVSPANAVGAMQVIPSSGVWASQMAGRDLDLLDPEDNATAGVLILKANLNAAGGDERTAVAAYYQGLGSVRKNGMYPDTVNYVNSAQEHKKRYR